MRRDGLHRRAARPGRARDLLAGEVMEIARPRDAVERGRGQAVVVIIGIGRLSETAERVRSSAVVLPDAWSVNAPVTPPESRSKTFTARATLAKPLLAPQKIDTRSVFLFSAILDLTSTNECNFL